MSNEHAPRKYGTAPRSFATIGAAVPELRARVVPLPPACSTRDEMIAAGILVPAELVEPRKIDKPTLTIERKAAP